MVRACTLNTFMLNTGRPSDTMAGLVIAPERDFSPKENSSVSWVQAQVRIRVHDNGTLGCIYV